MIISKSVERRLEVQQRDRQPKVPDFNDQAQATYDKLLAIWNAGGPMSLVAAGILNRLCVLRAPNTTPFNNEQMMARTLDMMSQLEQHEAHGIIFGV